MLTPSGILSKTHGNLKCLMSVWVVWEFGRVGVRECVRVEWCSFNGDVLFIGTVVPGSVAQAPATVRLRCLCSCCRVDVRGWHPCTAVAYTAPTPGNVFNYLVFDAGCGPQLPEACRPLPCIHSHHLAQKPFGKVSPVSCLHEHLDIPQVALILVI